MKKKFQHDTKKVNKIDHKFKKISRQTSFPVATTTINKIILIEKSRETIYNCITNA
jgi:hypothetical protein